jgi:hypothetical protein
MPSVRDSNARNLYRPTSSVLLGSVLLLGPALVAIALPAGCAALQNPAETLYREGEEIDGRRLGVASGARPVLV